MSDLMAVGRDGGERAIPRSAVAELAARLAGELLTARSEGSEDARLVWNGMIDRRPALVVRPLGTADVRDAVNFAREHDLLLAGGGGNFGVVTTFEFALHPVGPEIALCFVLYPYAEAATVLRFYRDWGAEAPDEISSIAFLGSVPVTDAYPAAIHGQPFVAVMACHCGPVEEGERALQPLRTITRPLLDMSGPTPYVAMQRALDEDYPAHALRYYWKSTFVDGLRDEAIDRLVELGAQMPSALSTIDIWCLGGAVARASGDAGAFGGRSAAFGVNPEANWERPGDDDANIAWARECWRDMRRFSSGGVYLNFPGFYEEGEATMRATFGGKYDRLVALKARYDPNNLLHLNQNIAPPGE